MPRTGRELWRGSVGAPLAAGVGSDGTLAAVVTREQRTRRARRRQRRLAPEAAGASALHAAAGGRRAASFVQAADRIVPAP